MPFQVFIFERAVFVKKSISFFGEEDLLKINNQYIQDSRKETHKEHSENQILECKIKMRQGNVNNNEFYVDINK